MTSAALLAGSRTSLNLHQRFPSGISSRPTGGADGGGASFPSLPLKRRADCATTDFARESPKACKIEDGLEKWRPEEAEDGDRGEVGKAALFDYGKLFPQELSDAAAAGGTNFHGRAEDRDLEGLKRELSAKKERLIRITAVSLMGRPDLENPTDATRIAVLEAASSVAERDAEFVLKVEIH